MDLNTFLEGCIEFNIEKPYGIIIAQLVFDSFRKYCIEYIEDVNIDFFGSLYELVSKYTDEPFKKYVDEVFQDEYFIQFDAQDLCLEFFKKFLTYLVSVKEGDEINEDKITDFLDYNIFKYFEIILADNKEYYFFSRTYEDELHIDIFEQLLTKLKEVKSKEVSGEIINTPIDNQEEVLPKRSLSHALFKARHKQTKKRNLLKATIAFSKTRKQK